jgi:hypothetical protein
VALAFRVVGGRERASVPVEQSAFAKLAGDLRDVVPAAGDDLADAA